MNPKKHSGTTITRIIGIRLSNGKFMEAPVEIWLTALLQALPSSQLEILFPMVEKLNAQVKVTPLDDGMALVHNPIVGAGL